MDGTTRPREPLSGGWGPREGKRLGSVLSSRGLYRFFPGDRSLLPQGLFRPRHPRPSRPLVSPYYPIDNSMLCLYRPAPAPLAVLGRGGAGSRLKGTGGAGRGLEGDIQGPGERARGALAPRDRVRAVGGAQGSSRVQPGSSPTPPHRARRRPTTHARSPRSGFARRPVRSAAHARPAPAVPRRPRRDCPLQAAGGRAFRGRLSGRGTEAAARSAELSLAGCPELLRASVFSVSKMGMISLFPSTE